MFDPFDQKNKANPFRAAQPQQPDPAPVVAEQPQQPDPESENQENPADDE